MLFGPECVPGTQRARSCYSLEIVHSGPVVRVGIFPGRFCLVSRSRRYLVLNSLCSCEEHRFFGAAARQRLGMNRDTAGKNHD